MTFRKYQSIKRATVVETYNYYIQMGYDKLDWYITSKIHGTNISLIINGIDLKFAQRTQITDSIFGSHLDLWKVEDKVKALAKHLGYEIQVYGEYYGGGQSIAGKSSIPYFKDPNRKEFIFFDIRNTETDEFLSYPENFELLAKFELPTVPVLGVGTLQEVLKHPNTFKSKIAENDCIEEGYVAKPFKAIMLASNERVILKMIAPEFDDVKKSKKDLEIAQNKQEKFDIYNLTADLIAQTVNSIRVDKVTAKFGVDSKKKFGLLLNELVADVISETIEKVSEEQIKNACVPFVKAYFENFKNIAAVMRVDNCILVTLCDTKQEAIDFLAPFEQKGINCSVNENYKPETKHYVYSKIHKHWVNNNGKVKKI